MKAVLVALGSAGDVHPFLAVGQALAARGHEVEILANPVFAESVAQDRFAFTAVGTVGDFTRTIRHPLLWHPVNGFGVMWRGLLQPAIEPVYTRLAEIASETHCVVLASPVAFGARLAQEKLGVPLVCAYTAATMLRSVADPLTIANWRVPTMLPSSARKLAWSLLDYFKLEPMAAPALNQLRARIGLPPVSGSVFGHWMHSPLQGVTLFPDWFAAKAKDWPAGVSQAGFPLYDGDISRAEDHALDQFLEQGAAPVVFAPGTAAMDTARFFDAAMGACTRLKMRAILVGGDAPPPGSRLSADIHHTPYAPFGQLLKGARAVVHHGGVGTLAQALRAGIPQVTVPRAYDQFDNGMRLETLGVGSALPHTKLSQEMLATALDDLLRDATVTGACVEAKNKMDPESARAAVCCVLEALQ